MDMLRGAHPVADIGCDHGRLSCALVQQELADACIAVDISAPSLKKTEQLAARVGVSDRVETRLGDGLSPVGPGEADAIAILGVGGTLMARMLEAAESQADSALMMIGDPEYYGRFFGFTAHATGNWDLPGPYEKRRLLARAVNGHGLPTGAGMIGPR